jgi:hypothetical protein
MCAVALGICLSPSCSDDADPTGVGQASVFVPFAPSPPSNSVTLQSGGTAGDFVYLRVYVKDVGDFFGAAFHVTFDPSSAAFLGYDSSSSFLRASGVSTLFNAVEFGPGEVAVAATRLQNASGTVPGVDVGSDGANLLLLSFRNTQRTAGNVFDLGTPRSVEACTSSGCAPVAVTWNGGRLVAN